MTAQFKAGDIVRRVGEKHGNVAKGETRVVLEVKCRTDGTYSVHLDGDIRGFYHSPDNLELVEARPTTPAHTKDFARKDDAGKLDMTLLDDMPRAIEAVVRVMQWANTEKKPVPYARSSWLGVSADRYRAAVMRHFRDAAHQSTRAPYEAPERQRDSETNMLHLAHAAASALMALEITLRSMEVQDAAIQKD